LEQLQTPVDIVGDKAEATHIHFINFRSWP